VYALVAKHLNHLVMLIMTILSITGCSSRSDDVHLRATTDRYYKYEGLVTEGKTKFNGLGVVPIKKQYNFKFEASNGDTVLFISCNRTRKKMDQGDDFNFIITPNDPERNDELCNTLEVESYDMKRQMHNFYLIAFDKKDFTLPFITTCDGYINKRKGTDACQIMLAKGVSYFEFESEVEIIKGKLCNLEFERVKDADRPNLVKYRINPQVLPEKIKYFRCGFLEKNIPYRMGETFIRVYDDFIIPREISE